MRQRRDRANAVEHQLAGADGKDQLDGVTGRDVCDGGPPVAGDTAKNCETGRNVQ